MAGAMCSFGCGITVVDGRAPTPLGFAVSGAGRAPALIPPVGEVC